MRVSRMGATLFELLVTLAVIGIVLAIALPQLRSGMAALAARSARESGFALFSRARVVALQQGGASIEVDARADRITVRNAAGREHFSQSFDEHDVDLVLEGTEQLVTLRLDAHGIGRMMSRTVIFRRDQAEAGLTISSFGRVRRW